MSEIACPYCRGLMQSPPDLCGKWVSCPLCHQQFVLPHGQQIFASPPAYAGSRPQTMHVGASHAASIPLGDWLSGIKVPILIAGILNAISAGVWSLMLLATCFGVVLMPIVVPLVILCVFEFVYYGSADTMPPRKAISDGRTIAICEIVAGVLSMNVVVLICGILALVNCGQAEQRLRMLGQ